MQPEAAQHSQTLSIDASMLLSCRLLLEHVQGFMAMGEGAEGGGLAQISRVYDLGFDNWTAP